MRERSNVLALCIVSPSDTNNCRCFPQDQLPLKSEPTFEADKCSVSWHADSTLEHFSTIGVYHSTSRTTAVPLLNASAVGNGSVAATGTEEEEGADQSWRVALRVWYDAEGPNATRALSSRANEMSAGARIAPAVAVPLPSRAAYFLLDDFNHHHQHAGKQFPDLDISQVTRLTLLLFVSPPVLAGNTYRYASTHRVCKTEGHTFQSVRARCVRLLQVLKPPSNEYCCLLVVNSCGACRSPRAARRSS